MCKKNVAAYIHKTIYSITNKKIDPVRIKKLMAFIYSFAEDILTRFNILATSYALLYEDSVKREVSMLDISKEMKILHIGCGSLPLTVKYLYKYTPAELIVGIDNTMRAVKNAKLYLNREDIRGRVKIEYGDGISYELEDFDIIFLSWGVEPREKVLHNIFGRMRKNGKLVLRLPSQDCLDEKLKRMINEHSMVITNQVSRPFFGSAVSILLMKK
ncbi:MAG TPA: methyltransferase domain-containing protein [Thermoplasmatales archaeon]|nr:methyltransferase domain-containing protein [Thermoplasmatales archaeon]